MTSTPPRDSTRDQLLRAAIRVFGAKGYEAATVREICREAKANVAAVNYHWGGKEALYAAALDFLFSSSKQYGRHIAPPPADAGPEERLAHIIRRSVHEVYGDLGVEEAEHSQALSSLFLLEMAHPSPGLDEVVRRYVRPDTEALYAALAELLDRDPGDDLVKDAAACIMGQVLVYTVSWPIIERLDPEARPASLERMSEVLTRFSLAGLRELRRNPV